MTRFQKRILDMWKNWLQNLTDISVVEESCLNEKNYNDGAA